MRFARQLARAAWPALLGSLFAAGCAPPPAERRDARAPAALAARAPRLLPRAALAASPPPTPPIPAFDRPLLLDGGVGARGSVGTNQAGYLLGGAQLSDSDGLALRPVSARRGAAWGAPALVAALERAAAAVARAHPGSVLWAGDLSARGGGPLPGHRSHAAGRDADLAFYLTGPDGALADGADMPRVGSDLLTADGRRFDVARNWALVAALLRDPSAQVQWLFVADPLGAALLAHAEASAADPVLIARARAVLVQPSDSSPHAEHFHLRLYCGRDERLQGCLDAPPFHPWIDRHEEAVGRWVDGLLPFLEIGWSEELRYAITRLVRMNAVSAIPALDALTRDADPQVAALARDAVAFLRGERTPDAWARWRARDVGD